MTIEFDYEIRKTLIVPYFKEAGKYTVLERWLPVLGPPFIDLILEQMDCYASGNQTCSKMSYDETYVELSDDRAIVYEPDLWHDDYEPAVLTVDDFRDLLLRWRTICEDNGEQLRRQNR